MTCCRYGWRGTAAGAAGALVQAMASKFSSRPADLVAAIGPSIGVCCYEVGSDVVDAFAAAGHERYLIDRWFPEPWLPRGGARGSRSGEEGRIRAELVKHGCVEAIVGLPGKLLPHTSIPLALWVIRRPVPEAAIESVLFIDAAEEVSPEHNVATWLLDEQARQSVPHALVAITDVLAALNAAVGILGALYRRTVTGHGDHVEVSLLDSALSGMVNLAQTAIVSG